MLTSWWVRPKAVSPWLVPRTIKPPRNPPTMRRPWNVQAGTLPEPIWRPCLGRTSHPMASLTSLTGVSEVLKEFGGLGVQRVSAAAVWLTTLMTRCFMRNTQTATPPRTGWPPALLQDDDRKLFAWFANRVDARYVLRKVLHDLQTHGPSSSEPKT